MKTVHASRIGFMMILLAFVMLLLSSAADAVGIPVSDFLVPYTSYTYDFWDDPVPAPNAYLPTRLIRGIDLGIGELKEPDDIYASSNGNLYIADTGNHRIIVFDREWNVLRIYDEFDNEGTTDSFASPRGIFVTEDESLYVADTGNARIVHFGPTGKLERIIGPPVSDVEGILPADFRYRPLKLGVDLHGRIYVISQDLYEGLISFSQDGDFRGFVGAPRVVPDLVDYLWSRLATKEQRAQMQVFLPTEYSNLDIDPEGFIYATVIDREDTDATGAQRERIRLLNAKGEDLLRRLGFHPPVGDIQFPDRHSLASRVSASLLEDVTVHRLGVYSVLDSNRGRVFTYDVNGNLLWVFGYRGRDHGQVAAPSALTHIGLDMMILDRRQGAVVLFEPTDYARLIWAAMDAYSRGRYAETEALWRKVLEFNTNYDLAYTGIGRSLLRRGEYGEALHYFKLGNNREGYSEAFDLYRRGVIYDRFASASVVIALVLAAIWAIRRYWRRRPVAMREEVAAAAVVDETATTPELWAGGEDYLPRGEMAVQSRGWWRETTDSLKYAFYVIFHPGEGFHQLKYGRRGTLSAATIIVAAVVATYVAARQYTGFVFNTADLTRLNLPMEIASILVPFLLWAGVNWALTTLMDGKGTFVDIIISTAFALVPIILVHAPMIVLSNYITVEEGTFYYFFNTLGVLWAAVLLVFGAVMTTHEYDLTKAVWTCIFTVAGMAFVMFLGFLGVNLSEQVFMFFSEIITELLYRT